MKFCCIFLITLTSYCVFTKPTEEFPYCDNNFSAEKGFPAGCMSSLQDFCVVQDEECGAIFCGFSNVELKKYFRTCNDICGGVSTEQPTEFTCHCMSHEAVKCLKNGREIEPQSSVVDSFVSRIAASKRETVSQFWGAKIEIVGEEQILVYCQGQKTSCNIGYSMCEQHNCEPGQCAVDDSCYFIENFRSTPEEGCGPLAKPVAIETVLEREALTFLVNEAFLDEDLKELRTSGIIEANELYGTWDGWNTIIDPSVVDIIYDLKPSGRKRSLTIIRGDDGMALWDLVTADKFLSDFVLCEVVPLSTSTSTEECDTSTTDDTSSTDEIIITTDYSGDDSSSTQEITSTPTYTDVSDLTSYESPPTTEYSTESSAWETDFSESDYSTDTTESLESESPPISDYPTDTESTFFSSESPTPTNDYVTTEGTSLETEFSLSTITGDITDSSSLETESSPMYDYSTNTDSSSLESESPSLSDFTTITDEITDSSSLESSSSTYSDSTITDSSSLETEPSSPYSTITDEITDSSSLETESSSPYSTITDEITDSSSLETESSSPYSAITDEITDSSSLETESSSPYSTITDEITDSSSLESEPSSPYDYSTITDEISDSSSLENQSSSPYDYSTITDEITDSSSLESESSSPYDYSTITDEITDSSSSESDSPTYADYSTITDEVTDSSSLESETFPTLSTDELTTQSQMNSDYSILTGTSILTTTTTKSSIDNSTLPDNNCDETNNSTEACTDEPTTTDDPSSSTIESLCSGMCLKTDQYGEEWECCSNTSCSKACPNDAEGIAFWTCGYESEFITSVPDYSWCHNTWVTNISEQIENDNITSWQLLKEIDLSVTDSSLFGHEMMNVLNFSETAMVLLIEEQSNEQNISSAKHLSERKYMADNAFKVIDRMVGYEKQWNQLKETEQIEVGSRMLEVLEFLGFAITELAKDIGEPYFCVSKWTYGIMESQFINYKPNTTVDDAVIMRFPISVKGSVIEIREHLWAFKNISLESVGTTFPMDKTEMMFPATRNSMEDHSKHLNSEMLTLTLHDSEGQPITSFSEDAVWITLVHELKATGPNDDIVHRDLYPDEKPTAIKGTQRCVFWNANLNNNHGRWDTTGCRLVSYTEDQSVCACNHLSSFALLIDIHGYVGKNPAMEILSIVCSCASVVCLLLTLFVLHFLKGIQSERNSIGKHVCICLVIGHIICLLLLDQALFHLPDGVCIAVGVILHYTFLAAFMWMAVEGHHLYRLVVRVFDSGKDLSRLYILLAYGTPAVIVGITAIVGVATHQSIYGSDGLCWLSSPNFIWAFMGPVFFITTLNLLILVLALRVAVTAGTQQKKSFIDKVRIWIRGWFSLSALLGITWLFGLIYIEWYYNLAYIFIILTGLQGVFIFLSKVVFNEQVKTAFKKSAKKRAMLRRFYSLAWKGRASGSSMQQSSWFLAGSSSSQLDLASSSSSYWDHTPSRRRSSTIQPDAFSDPEGLPNNGNFIHHLTSHVQVEKTSSWHKQKRDDDSDLPRTAVSYENDHVWSNRDADALSDIPEEGDSISVSDRWTMKY